MSASLSPSIKCETDETPKTTDSLLPSVKCEPNESDETNETLKTTDSLSPSRPSVKCETDETNETPKITDSYAYLDREHGFSSEKFKIEIRGLPKFYGIAELKKLLNKKLKLKSSKIKPPKRGSGWLYVCFRSEEDRQEAISKLSGYVWKNNKLTAQLAMAVPDPLVLKRNESNNRERSETDEKVTLDENLESDDLLKSSTVPLWNIPYEKQLEIKMDKMRSVLKKLGEELKIANRHSPSVLKFLESRSAEYDGLPCKLVDIQHAPEEAIINGYRNKCEFSVGLNGKTRQKTVGFRFGSYAQGSTRVGPVDDLPHVTASMKLIVKKFEAFVNESEFDAFCPETKVGLWKQLTVRLGTRTNEIMVIVGVNTNEIGDEQIQRLKRDITEFFTDRDGKVCGVTSLYLQTANFMLNQKFSADSLHLLHGSPTIVEILCGLKFYISPLSFFQPHTNTAEMLYNSVGDLISLSPNVTLLDICCGTGTIGLCLAKTGAQILGIESEATAISNAKYNCEQNDVKNCSFYHGRAEDILQSVICKATNSNIVAVLDPPRAGLHQKSISLLRKSNKIEKLVYLSCNPEAALKNLIALGRPPSKTLLGAQFFPVKAVPVDNFPFTNHCELVVCFERYENQHENPVTL